MRLHFVVAHRARIEKGKMFVKKLWVRAPETDCLRFNLGPLGHGILPCKQTVTSLPAVLHQWEELIKATKWHVVLATDNMWCNHYAGICQPLPWLLFWLLKFKPESNQVCLRFCDLLSQILHSWNLHWVIKCARHCAKCYDKWFGHKQTNPVLHHREFMFCWGKKCAHKRLYCVAEWFSLIVKYCGTSEIERKHPLASRGSVLVEEIMVG